MSFDGLRADGSNRCHAIAKATGERCRCVAVIGSQKCSKHGGPGRVVLASRIALRTCQRLRNQVPENVRADPLARKVTVIGRARIYEAAVTAIDRGDPTILHDAAREVADRYRRRLEACGGIKGSKLV